MQLKQAFVSYHDIGWKHENRTEFIANSLMSIGLTVDTFAIYIERNRTLLHCREFNLGCVTNVYYVVIMKLFTETSNVISYRKLLLKNGDSIIDGNPIH